MDKTNEYVYDIEEYSQDTRHYKLVSNVKLTYEEIRSIYSETGYDISVEDNLTAYVNWSDERFTDDELLNKIKICGVFKGTEYGDDCQLDITGELKDE
tara:strand:- start:3842 stop:4135 length:294 start_codon:yes stop_codon:yes gene_type:complete